MTATRRDRRYALAVAAIRLFGERGIDGTTVDDIAASAGVSERTFFRYFETKESAAFPDHADRVDALRRGLEARRPASAPLAAVVDVSRRSATEFFEDPALYRPRYRLVRSVPSLRDHERVADRAYEDAIAEFLQTERPGPVPDGFVTRAVAAAIVAVVNHALDLWAFDEGADGISLLDDGLDMITELFGPALDHVAPVGLEHPPGDLFVVIPGSDPLRARILELIADHVAARQVDPGGPASGERTASG
jgi:AcrR family transcriptional regulator